MARQRRETTEMTGLKVIKERTMKNITTALALLAVALGLAFSAPRDARADASGDPDFCYTGWHWVRTGYILQRVFTASGAMFYKSVDTGDWVCGS